MKMKTKKNIYMLMVISFLSFLGGSFYSDSTNIYKSLLQSEKGLAYELSVKNTILKGNAMDAIMVVDELRKENIRMAAEYKVKLKEHGDFALGIIKINIHEIIDNVAEKHKVDPHLVRAIVKAESSFNPFAKSYAGAMGLMQLMPKTAIYLNVDDAYHPEQNIDGGVKYVKYLLDKFENNLELTLAAYNAGEGKVRKYGGVPPYPATKKYIKKVKRFMKEYKNI